MISAVFASPPAGFDIWSLVIVLAALLVMVAVLLIAQFTDPARRDRTFTMPPADRSTPAEDVATANDAPGSDVAAQAGGKDPEVMPESSGPADIPEQGRQVD